MAKLKWNRSSGRGMGCGSGGHYNYGKGSGTDRTFLTVQITRIMKFVLKDGYKFIIFYINKNSEMYKLATDDLDIIKQLRIGAKIDCIGEPCGLKTLILKEITFL